MIDSLVELALAVETASEKTFAKSYLALFTEMEQLRLDRGFRWKEGKLVRGIKP